MPTAAELHLLGERVSSALGLREPQREAMVRLLGLLAMLGDDPLGTSAPKVSESLRRLFASTGSPLEARLDPRCAALTFDLATGVGKTKLAAALMAVLSSAGLCRSFWIVAPRRAIADKFVRELSPSHQKYLFSGLPNFLPPAVMVSGGILDAEPLLRSQDRVHIAVATAQWITNGAQVHVRSDFTGLTPIEEMKAKGPVVAIIDESHHFDASVWSTVPEQLGASLVIKLTATPTKEEAVLFSYPLGKCLQEGQYTKRPDLHIQKLGAGFSADDADRLALRDALACLRRVEPALQRHASANGVPCPPPIALIAARDTAHANEVEKVLVNEFGLTSAEVLVFHSKRLSDEVVDQLLAVESPSSKIRIVIQVFALEEGWDVSNVYAIVPLRDMATYRGIRQLMGRGLRLPFGTRVGVEEIDSLTILAYGRATVAEIVREATEDLGKDAVSVTAIEPLGPPEQLQSFVSLVVPERLGTGIRLVRADLVPVAGTPDLSRLAELGYGAADSRFDFETRQVFQGVGLDDLSAEDWSLVVAHAVIDHDPRLSVPRHGELLASQIRDLLKCDSALTRQGRRVPLPDAIALILGCCGHSWQSQPARYEPTNVEHIVFSEMKYQLRSSQPRPLHPSNAELHARQGIRCPATGFKKSVLSVGMFDSGAEVRMAQRLDSMKEVNWWLRNDPRQVQIPTTDVPSTSPDFIVSGTIRGKECLVVVEVKGRDLWIPPNSQARRQARDLAAWSKSSEALTGIEAHVAFVSDADVDHLDSLEETLSAALDPDH